MNSAKNWYLGIDLGTGSCKTLIIDPDMNILASTACAYTADGQSSWKEQDPLATLDAVIRAVREVQQKAAVNPSDCRGISIGCALHGVMAVDRDGNPLTGVMTWSDDRAAAQSEAYREQDTDLDLYRQTGCPIHWMYWPYKIRWLKEQKPEIFSRCAKFLSVKDFIIHKLTGSYLIDYAVAGGSGLLDVHSLYWCQDALELAGIRADQLPEPVSPHYVIEGIDPQMAEQLGLPANVPLVMGVSDAANSSLGAGSVHAEQATCMIGTSAALRIINPRPLLDAEGRSWCYPFDDHHWLVGGALNNGGIVLAWLRDMLNNACGSHLSFEEMLAMAEKSPIGSNGLLVLPFLAGQRSPEWTLNSRGTLFGLTLEHSMQDIARAFLEGIVFRMRLLRDVLSSMQVELTEIRTSGGGSRSRFWMQMLADVLGQTISLPETEETSSFGAALWALKGTGGLDSFENISEKIHITDQIEPDKNVSPEYENIYQQSLELNRLLKPFQEVFIGRRRN